MESRLILQLHIVMNLKNHQIVKRQCRGRQNRQGSENPSDEEAEAEADIVDTTSPMTKRWRLRGEIPPERNKSARSGFGLR